MNILTILQIIISVLLVVVVIVQSRGGSTAGAGALGGYGESYRSKKGIERILFYSTVVLAVLFASISILSVLV